MLLVQNSTNSMEKLHDEKRYIALRMTVLKIDIWKGKSSVLWPKIAFYGDVLAEPLNEFPIIKPTIYLPK